MRKFKINAAAVSPSTYANEVDEEFLQDMSSIITLEDGSSLDLKNAVLLYNPDNHKIQISDANNIPKGFNQLATLNLTDEKPEPEFEPEVIEDEPLPEQAEETIEEAFPEDNGEDRTTTGDDRMGATAAREDSGDFFQ